MQLNTTGASNTAIGVSALNSNTTANDNTAIGLSSLGVNTTGTFNTAVGRSSLNANTTGNYNTALGGQALANITTGSQNIAIGYNCGSGITTGSFNTIIGTSVTGLSATLSNNIILADGAGNVRLFSDANGLIGIGQAVGTPGGQLDIHTTQTYALVLNGLSTNNAYTAFSNNSVGKRRIGNTYNAGANTFDIYNLTTSANAISITSANKIGIFGNTTPYTTLDVRSGVARAIGSTTTDFVSGTTGSVIWLGLAAATGNTYGRIQVTGSGDTSSAPLSLQAGSGNVIIGSTTDDTINKLQVTGSAIISNTLNSVVSYGKSYNQTSTSVTTSIVDTGIYFNTSINGFNTVSIYLLTINGNPNGGGSGSYNNCYLGYIYINTGYSYALSPPNVVQYINYYEVITGNASGITPLVVSVAFWDGTTESLLQIDGTTTNQIRIKITGYNSSYVGNSQSVLLTKIK
jgi:hypothetical protein